MLGLQGSPNAGDEFLAVENERKAREVALYRQGKFRDVKLAKQASKMGDVFAQMEEQKLGIIPILLKTDVQGSAEALRDALTKLVDRRSAGQDHRERRRRHHRSPTCSSPRRPRRASSASTCVPMRPRATR